MCHLKQCAINSRGNLQWTIHLLLFLFCFGPRCFRLLSKAANIVELPFSWSLLPWWLSLPPPPTERIPQHNTAHFQTVTLLQKTFGVTCSVALSSHFVVSASWKRELAVVEVLGRQKGVLKLNPAWPNVTVCFGQWALQRTEIVLWSCCWPSGLIHCAANRWSQERYWAVRFRVLINREVD